MSNISGDFYLAVKKKRWNDLSARLCNKVPALSAGEVAVKLSISVPSALFERPQLQAKIVVPESAVSKPVIDATVLDNIQTTLNQQFGLDVKVSVLEQASLTN